jgi:hypothetical protein
MNTFSATSKLLLAATVGLAPLPATALAADRSALERDARAALSNLTSTVPVGSVRRRPPFTPIWRRLRPIPSQPRRPIARTPAGRLARRDCLPVMGPKVDAACRFVRATGKRAAIGELAAGAYPHR